MGQDLSKTINRTLIDNERGEGFSAGTVGRLIYCTTPFHSLHKAREEEESAVFSTSWSSSDDGESRELWEGGRGRGGGGDKP